MISHADYTQIYALKQGPKETVDELMERMDAIERRLPEPAPENIKKFAFISALRPQLRLKVEEQQVATMDDAIDAARRQEEIYLKVYGPRKDANERQRQLIPIPRYNGPPRFGNRAPAAAETAPYPPPPLRIGGYRPTPDMPPRPTMGGGPPRFPLGGGPPRSLNGRRHNRTQTTRNTQSTRNSRQRTGRIDTTIPTSENWIHRTHRMATMGHVDRKMLQMSKERDTSGENAQEECRPNEGQNTKPRRRNRTKMIMTAWRQSRMRTLTGRSRQRGHYYACNQASAEPKTRIVLPAWITPRGRKAALRGNAQAANSQRSTRNDQRIIRMAINTQREAEKIRNRRTKGNRPETTKDVEISDRDICRKTEKQIPHEKMVGISAMQDDDGPTGSTLPKLRSEDGRQDR